jgi:hypothetical protein
VAVELRIVDGVALQQADLHGLALGIVVAHAGVLAQDLGRAHTRAAAAEDVLPAGWWRAPSILPSWMLRMKLATSMPVGQARVQGAS